MNKYLKDVKEFHENFNAIIENEIVEDNLDVRKLRLSLIFEEMVELGNAMGCTAHLEDLCENHKIGTHPWILKSKEEPYDKKETLDALCDLQYVSSGSVISLGYSNIFDDAFQDVHISNMSKLCDDIVQAEETITYYINEREEKKMLNIIPKGDKFIVLREDGKVMKNIHYNAVKLDKYIK